MSIDLSKGQPVTLAKADGNLTFNLNWRQGTGADADAGVLFERTGLLGGKGCVQALGGRFGSLEDSPYVQLDSDDRTGNSASGETMRFNMTKLGRKGRRDLAYAYIYSGADTWDGLNAVATITEPSGNQLVYRLDSPAVSLGHDNHHGMTMCAVAMIDWVNGAPQVTPLGTYHRSHEDMDNHYNWGLSWRPARKN